ncbi:Phosphate-binding protein PstS 3 precursor [Corynebacterium atrinae]|uniref:phosphate ABC transporter substrate-binding protein PstS n=1 Tax=Corynebacterium atrinae TaxID=1336740 RepID=UPI0025B3E49D|nr:phosphate ABC transporter substrate-binding protein PstS [Corynebacterium atrinae]WJY64262.1 Phosphate-binding protein PstS 3 precursor [Corynebacterium atrinae]
MTRNFKRTAAVIGLVAAGSAALVACSESESGTSGAGSATGGAPVEGLSGASGQLVAEGASSQQNAMDYFNVKYQGATNNAASLAYTPSGSGSGRTNFIGGQVKFAGSDSPLSADQVGPAAERCGGNDAWHLPFVIGPVAIAFNLDGVDDVNLSIPTVAKIFKGEINKWNDPAIAAENEGVELPDTAISVVYRSDESGTSDNFQKFLKAAAPEEWDTTGQQFPSAVGEGANGSNGVTTQVGQIDGGITYVESGFATQQELGIANLDFGSGPVELSTDSVGIALDNLEFKSTGHDMVVDTEALFGSTDAGSYPLILTTYEIVCSAGYDENTSNQVKDFLTVALANQDEGLADLGYIPVTGTHHDRLVEAVEAIQ